MYLQTHLKIKRRKTEKNKQNMEIKQRVILGFEIIRIYFLLAGFSAMLRNWKS